ncbi:response regulator transcription factor [Paenibacillus sp. FSL R7-0048]|uniref:response regulator transcription factor n=1 Tax=Paenibacillus TaxID=44249 RepID=UPI00096F569D|nr:response regulator transcription factor [Paenibacillus odorifer]OMC75565.1 DNA-binding response regulator [Paenibacillus odorifer]OMD73404.1 DNA-binding response regulator [Paenibacillus odorifer]OMD84246.1 DNA-binding response regulator [Paenibacillus odorifer]OMD85051.1 DNA-binding response regulator [Paenibacillus odorifer]OME01308.1 DNA-binding response regulator [Paenibacillus odorifer]
MKKKLLLVEDEIRIRELVSDYFLQNDWEVLEADNGKDALVWFDSLLPDLLILDIMMPAMNGFEVCREVREKSAVPIILLTAKSTDDDKIYGFELGADDYVTKPFSPKVLVARANALMKRVEGTHQPESSIIKFGSAMFNPLAHRLEVEDAEVELTPKEYDLLWLLIRNKGIVISRDTILSRIWGIEFEGDSRVVDSHIKKLRSKLGYESRFIRTVIGTGYMFEEEA